MMSAGEFAANRHPQSEIALRQVARMTFASDEELHTVSEINAETGEIKILSATKRKRRTRPKLAADDTLPIFPDQPQLIWCPYTRGNYKDGHFAPVSSFGRNRSRVSGLSVYCKECRKIGEKKYRASANKRSVVKEMRGLGKRIEKAVIRVLTALDAITERAGELSS